MATRRKTDANTSLSSDQAGASPAPGKRARKPRAAKRGPSMTDAEPAAREAAVHDTEQTAVMRAAHEPVPAEEVTEPAGMQYSEPAENGASANHRELVPAIPEREEIERLAYSYWQGRGGQGGSAEEDWLRAEGEVRARRTRQ